jgi:hypothetical protein
MNASHWHLTRRFALATGVLLGLTASSALLIRLAFEQPARRLLDVHFAVVRQDAASALGIWAHNTTIVLGFAVFMACSSIAGQTRRAPERMLLGACDLALCLWAAATALLAGVLLGAYGARQARAFLPQGPVELAAWSLLIVLYVDVRRRRLSAGPAATRLAAILGLLGVAAVLELWAGR